LKQCAAAALFCLVATTGNARAQTGLLNHDSAKFASDNGNLAYLGLGVALPLLTDGRDGKDHALRTADALGTSVLLAEGLKMIVREKRPDSNERTSFPSGHATAAFAVAAMESHYHRRFAPLWYLGAGLIADSRVTLHRHYPRDVIAGGLLGVGTAIWEWKAPHGLLLAPLIRHDGAQGTTHLMTLSAQF
jgi:membrane-associated phospholipid phosphatase